jgi:hypothetical protein
VREQRDYMEQLETFKKQVKAIVPIKEMEVSHYKEFADFLVKYEENNAKKAKMDDPLTVKLLTGDSKMDLKQKLIDNATSMRNPFKYIYNWIKGELYDLNCVLECIARKEGIESTKSKAISKVKDNKDTVEKMNTGKFTFKGMFMSNTSKASETQNILQNISQTERDIQNYEVIKNYLIIYLAEIAIPAFKHQKAGNYLRAMAGFCGQEISNSRLQGDTWNEFEQSVRYMANIHHVQIKFHQQ